LASKIGQALIAKGVYGATVDELEPSHIAPMPIPMPSDDTQRDIHRLVVKAYRLRDEANDLLEQADHCFHTTIGVSQFAEDDIEYYHRHYSTRMFSVASGELDDRLDASNHVPLVRSVIHKLKSGRFGLKPLGDLCSEIYQPARFKREYVATEHGVPYLLPSQLPAMRPYGMKAISERQAGASREYLLKPGRLLVSTDGTIGRVHPVTKRMVGWFASNNLARLWDEETKVGFLYCFLTTPFGLHQLCKDIYGGVVDHISEKHIASVLCPNVPPSQQTTMADLVTRAFDLKDKANAIEDEAIAAVELLVE
jgi:type I restriction enzyme S subunit